MSSLPTLLTPNNRKMPIKRDGRSSRVKASSKPKNFPNRSFLADNPRLCNMRKVPCSRSCVTALKASATISSGNKVCSTNAALI